MVTVIENTKPNPLVKIFTDLIYYQAFPAADVPAHLQTEVTALLATYPADPYLDEHRHLMSHVDGLVAALAAKETPDGAQAKANAVLALAKTFTTEQLAALVEQAPATLDTLNELAAALGDDPNFATTVANQIGTKVDKITGKGLSTNDYTAAEKTKLGGIAAGANNYVHPATHAASMITGLSTVATSGSYNDLLGKPSIPAAVTLNDTVTSTSKTEAATANAVKTVYDQALAAFLSASNGKTLLANAITGKGVAASGSDAFEVLAGKIGQISTGYEERTGNAPMPANAVVTVNLPRPPRGVMATTTLGAGTAYHSSVIGSNQAINMVIEVVNNVVTLKNNSSVQDRGTVEWQAFY